MPPITRYANSFQAKEDVASYDLKEYWAGSYSSRIWELQRPLLAEILLQHQAEVRHSLTLLDFACGTGRVRVVHLPRYRGLDYRHIAKGH